jgi:N6-adenosine-specific RNA methylase IME4
MEEMRPIGAIKVRGRYRKDLGDLESLRANMAEVGLINALSVWPDGTLIAGERRLSAARELGWTEVRVHVVEGLDELLALKAEAGENTCRKDFLPTEAVAVAAAIEEGERREARRRQGLSGGKGRIARGKLPPAIAGKTRDKVGAFVGMSGRTLEKARAVVEAAAAEPGRFGRLAADMDRTGRVDGVHRRLVSLRAAEAIAAEPPPLPSGRYRVIVVDPPWHYDKRAEDPSHRAVCPYPSMSLDAIRALDVAGRAHRDCVLWLWTTNAHLFDAGEVLKAWGFTYKTTLTWAKDKMGTGDWLRGQTEHCLMAVRGNPTTTLTNQTTLLGAPAGRHSEKPAAFYALVESLCPGSRLELFARRRREGWTAHGNEVGRAEAG